MPGGGGGDVLVVYDELAVHSEAWFELQDALEPDVSPTMKTALRRVLYSGLLQRCAR